MGRSASWIDKDLVDLVDLPCVNPSCNEPQFSDRLGPSGLCKHHLKISHSAHNMVRDSTVPEFTITLP